MVLKPQILRYSSLPSTNSEASRLALEGAPEGLCIVADEQTAGRGRLQRQWISPRGAGLYMSMILRPRQALETWPVLTLMSAVAVTDTLKRTDKVQADIKWPNDVLVQGRKICGILAETHEAADDRLLVLGIGINLTATAFPPELRETATSVAEVTGKMVDHEIILTTLLKSLSRYYELFQQGSFDQIIDAWCKRSSYANGKLVRVVSEDQSIEGTTLGLEPDGALRIVTSAGEVKIIRAGDVTAVRPDEESSKAFR